MASHEPTAEDHNVSAWKVLAAMVLLLVVGIVAVVLFGYPALIALALAGTAAVLCTLVVMTAGR